MVTAMFYLPTTHRVELSVAPVTRAGNAATGTVSLQVDAEYLEIEEAGDRKWRLTPKKVGTTAVTATCDDVASSAEVQIVSGYRLEFVFGPPTEKTRLVAPDRTYTADGDSIEIDAEHGVLNFINRVDMYGHADEIPREDLTAHLLQRPSQGHVELESDGSFVYFV